MSNSRLVARDMVVVVVIIFIMNHRRPRRTVSNNYLTEDNAIAYVSCSVYYNTTLFYYASHTEVKTASFQVGQIVQDITLQYLFKLNASLFILAGFNYRHGRY